MARLGGLANQSAENFDAFANFIRLEARETEAQGGIEGSVIVPNILLNGIVRGDIDATERVELGAKARVLGNVRYSVIETAVGAQINGKLIHRAPGGTGGGEPESQV